MASGNNFQIQFDEEDMILITKLVCLRNKKRKIKVSSSRCLLFPISVAQTGFDNIQYSAYSECHVR